MKKNGGGGRYLSFFDRDLTPLPRSSRRALGRSFFAMAIHTYRLQIALIIRSALRLGHDVIHFLGRCQSPCSCAHLAQIVVSREDVVTPTLPRTVIAALVSVAALAVVCPAHALVLIASPCSRQLAASRLAAHAHGSGGHQPLPAMIGLLEAVARLTESRRVVPSLS